MLPEGNERGRTLSWGGCFGGSTQASGVSTVALPCPALLHDTNTSLKTFEGLHPAAQFNAQWCTVRWKCQLLCSCEAYFVFILTINVSDNWFFQHLVYRLTCGTIVPQSRRVIHFHRFEQNSRSKGEHGTKPRWKVFLVPLFCFVSGYQNQTFDITLIKYKLCRWFFLNSFYGIEVRCELWIGWCVMHQKMYFRHLPDMSEHFKVGSKLDALIHFNIITLWSVCPANYRNW